MRKALKSKRGAAGRLACALLGAFAFAAASAAGATVYPDSGRPFGGPEAWKAEGPADSTMLIHMTPVTTGGMHLMQVAGELRPVLYGRFGYPEPGQPGTPALRMHAATPAVPAWMASAGPEICPTCGGTGVVSGKLPSAWGVEAWANRLAADWWSIDGTAKWTVADVGTMAAQDPWPPVDDVLPAGRRGTAPGMPLPWRWLSLGGGGTISTEALRTRFDPEIAASAFLAMNGSR